MAADVEMTHYLFCPESNYKFRISFNGSFHLVGEFRISFNGRRGIYIAKCVLSIIKSGI